MSYHKIRDIEAVETNKNNERTTLAEAPGVVLAGAGIGSSELSDDDVMMVDAPPVDDEFSNVVNGVSVVLVASEVLDVTSGTLCVELCSVGVSGADEVPVTVELISKVVRSVGVSVIVLSRKCVSINPSMCST